MAVVGEGRIWSRKGNGTPDAGSWSKHAPARGIWRAGFQWINDMTAIRQRLPNRRPAMTEDIDVGHTRLTATIGFDPKGDPAEVFLSGAKDGSGMAVILEDVAVVISLALQHDIPARVLGKSIARQPESLDGPSTAAASPIGAVLDLLSRYERGAT
jgi:hypothetical protein